MPRTQNADDILASSNLPFHRLMSLSHGPPLRIHNFLRGALQNVHDIPHIPQWLPREPVHYPSPERWRANVVHQGQNVLTRNVKLAVHVAGQYLSLLCLNTKEGK